MTNQNAGGWLQTLKNAHQKFEVINPEKAKVLYDEFVNKMKMFLF